MNNNIDIKNLKVAKRYAKALAESAVSNIDEINRDVDMIFEVIFKNEDFKTFFLHPIISLKDKKETIEQTLKDKINKKTLNFIETLLDENRFGIYPTIKEVFKKEVDIIKNKQQIEIISAIELDEEQKRRLEEKLEEKIKKDIVLNCKEDKSILGGLVIKFEDNVIDLSLKNKFDTLKKSVLN